MHFFTLLVITCSICLCIDSRILFPEEVVSFLSFVYSVLPPIKVGKDSRIGAGFRVGQNADFQFLIELGPQSETQPLGTNGNTARDTRASKKHDIKVNTKPQNRRKQFRNAANKNATEQKTNSTKNATQSESL